MTFDARSQAVLAHLHPDLAVLAVRSHKACGIQLIEGWRSNAQQQLAYATGKSKAKPGSSAHNAWPARAFDFLPKEFHGNDDWDNIPIFRGAAHIILGEAHKLMIERGTPDVEMARWGGDWNMNGSEADEKGLRDFDHIELWPWRTYGGVNATFK